MNQNNINDLVIKQQNCDPQLHRWKTWNPNTPFAPNIDASLYVSNLEKTLSDSILSIIYEKNLGYYSGDEWKSYNIFSFEFPCLKILRDRIWDLYLKYCKSLSVESYPQDEIWIRGWAVKLEETQSLKMHSHSLHENTFLSGNISLTENNTVTDYWIPLFSLYHGTFKCENHPGKIVIFPSWIQHAVDPNTSGKARYSLAFDMFSKHTMNFILENRNDSSETQNVILMSKKLSEI